MTETTHPCPRTGATQPREQAANLLRKKLLGTLTACAGMLDTIKLEWQPVNAWSEYDQSVRSDITECLAALDSNPAWTAVWPLSNPGRLAAGDIRPPRATRQAAPEAPDSEQQAETAEVWMSEYELKHMRRILAVMGVGATDTLDSTAAMPCFWSLIGLVADKLELAEHSAATTASASGRCGRCNGRGLIDNSSPVRSTCPRCNGTGRSTAPSSNAAPLDVRELRREIGKASVGACNCGSKGGPLRENHAYACRYRALDAAMAFIDQQGAAQAAHAGAASCRNAIINSGARAWPRSCPRCGIAKNCPDGVVVAMSAATEQGNKNG